MRASLKMKAAAAILLAYLIASVLSPHLADKNAIEHWNDKMYWVENPKLAPPEWVNLFGRNLPPTEELKPSRAEDGLYVYEYDFHYSAPPQDIVIHPNSSSWTTVNLTMPDGREYTVYEGLPRDQIRLAMAFPVLQRIARDNGINCTTSDLIFNGLEPIFREKGTYTIKVVTNGKPSVKVLGKTYGLMGTDGVGRDVWQGFIWGLRETMEMVVAVGAIAVLLGTLLGIASALSGLAGSVTDALSKLSTVLPLVPVMVMIIPITGKVSYGGHLKVPFWSFVLVMGFLLFGKVSRNVRALVETELSKEYVESSRSLGGSKWWILRYHISKAVLPYSVYQFSTLMPKVVALVSLLGFFEAIPGFNWGTLLGSMITEHQLFSMAWWIVLPIGTALALFAMAFVLINLEMEERFLEM